MFRWVQCRRRGLSMALVLACMCPTLTFAAAQARRDSTATLVVQVMDTAEAPVPLADVILRRAGMQATTGAPGRVTLRNVPPGLDTLVVRRLGYDPLIVAVRFFAGDTLSVEAVLDARLVALEEIEVVGRPGLSTFERRMNNAIFSPPNSFYTPEALDTFPPEIHLREILTRSGILRRPVAAFDRRGRKVTGRIRLTCDKDPLGSHFGKLYPPVIILLNGIPYPDPDDDFFEVKLGRARIKALEIYRNPMEMPNEFPPEVSKNGCAVVVWTK